MTEVTFLLEKNQTETWEEGKELKVEWKNAGHSIYISGDWTAVAVEGQYLHLYRYRSELHNDFVGKYFSWKFLDKFIMKTAIQEKTRFEQINEEVGFSADKL